MGSLFKAAAGVFGIAVANPMGMIGIGITVVLFAHAYKTTTSNRSDIKFHGYEFSAY